MDILTKWLRAYLPALDVDDRQLAEDLTLRGIAVEGEFDAACGGARFEMDITTNRVDAMNHYGVAREVAAIYGVELLPLAGGAAVEVSEPLPPTSQSRDVGHPVSLQERDHGFPVRIEATDLCGRFTARVVRGVTVGPSSGLLAEYFAALGQKPISAPVDVTNFGWLAMGQPTHVFDLDTIVGGIVVRRAHAGEKLRLLDGSEKVLVTGDLVVADEVKALGLAGVMGGWDSRVTEATRNILVEAAWFDPAAIRASSRRHGLHTDASHRFERGADFNAAPVANNLVTRLVMEQAGGEVVGPLVDVVIPALAAKTADRAPIALRVSEVTRHLGTTLDDLPAGTAPDDLSAATTLDDLSAGTSGRSGLQPGQSTSPLNGALAPEASSSLNAELVTRTLTALGCVLTETAPGAYSVQLPSWRLDLEREIDLIEEVARVYGYNRFANTLPGSAGAVREQPHAAAERIVRETLRGLGLSEAVSSTFVSEAEAAAFGDAAKGAVAMGNPLSAEAGMLRPSLAPGMATMLALNLHRDVSAVRLFEMGTVFTGSTAAVTERVGLALGATGGARATGLHKADDALFYEVKGVLESLLAKFAGAVTFEAAGLPAWIAAGRGARVLLDGTDVGVFGELNAAEAQARKLRQVCLIASLDAQALLGTALRQPVVRELSRYQAVERDFSFVFADAVRWSAIEAAVRGLGIAALRTALPVEIFRDPKGKAVAVGSYSLLVRVVFQSGDRTLTEDELTGNSDRVVEALRSLGGVQRA